MNANRMFYVIYNPVTKQYLDGIGGFGSYEGAAQFPLFQDAVWGVMDGLRVVGPCVEGETP